MGNGSQDIPVGVRWQDRAACRGVDPAVFFPSTGEPLEPALAVCRGCPVRAECLAYALTFAELEGIFGGVSARERRRMLPKTPPPAPVARPVGLAAPSIQGYRHDLTGDVLCCTVCGAGGTIRRGLCIRHYEALRAHGDPLGCRPRGRPKVDAQ